MPSSLVTDAGTAGAGAAGANAGGAGSRLAVSGGISPTSAPLLLAGLQGLGGLGLGTGVVVAATTNSASTQDEDDGGWTVQTGTVTRGAQRWLLHSRGRCCCL